MTMDAEKYDSMTPEERQLYDLEQKRREDEEQASKSGVRWRRTELPYQWKQTLADVDVTIQVPPGTRAKQLNVSFTKSRLVVGLVGQEPIVQGELHKEIIVDGKPTLL